MKSNDFARAAVAAAVGGRERTYDSIFNLISLFQRDRIERARRARRDDLGASSAPETKPSRSRARARRRRRPTARVMRDVPRDARHRARASPRDRRSKNRRDTGWVSSAMTLAMALTLALRGASCDARATSSRKLLRREPAGASRPVHREHLSSGVSKELVQRVARRDGGVAVTFANEGMYDFVVNWCEHMDEIGITNYLVGAMDESLYGRLRKIGVNAWLMGSKNIDDDEVKKDFGWGTRTFHKMGRDKIRLVHELTKTGFDVIVTDVDAVWLRDPFPFLRRYPKADALVSIDNLRNHTSVVATQANHAVDGEGLEHSACGGNKNIGIMWFRSTEGSQSFTQEWLNKLESNDKDWDQVVFNKLVEQGGCETARDGSGVAPAYGGGLMLGILPVAFFANGYTYFTERLHEMFGLKPYAVHTTFGYAGTVGKRHRLREANQWYGDKYEPTYFQGKFMSYTPRLLKDVDYAEFVKRGHPNEENTPMLERDEDVVLEHMRFVNHQLAQLYEAAVVAKHLGRALILPPFACGLDRVWFPHKGRYPGALLKLPFVCPADHVLKIEELHEFAQDYREFSFLGHPYMPRHFLTSENVRRVEIPSSAAFEATIPFHDKLRACFEKRDRKRGDESCLPEGNAVFRAAETIKLSARLGSLDALSVNLESAKDVKFLHFDTIIGLTETSQATTAMTTQIPLGDWGMAQGTNEDLGKLDYSLDNVSIFGDAPPSPSKNETHEPEESAERSSEKESEASTADDVKVSIEAGLMKMFHGDKNKVESAVRAIMEAQALEAA